MVVSWESEGGEEVLLALHKRRGFFLGLLNPKQELPGMRVQPAAEGGGVVMRDFEENLCGGGEGEAAGVELKVAELNEGGRERHEYYMSEVRIARKSKSGGGERGQADFAHLVGVEVGVAAEQHPQFAVPHEFGRVETHRSPGVDVVETHPRELLDEGDRQLQQSAVLAQQVHRLQVVDLH
jgi:hypothetical protein